MIDDALDFDWNPPKAASNLAKHKFSFADARRFAFGTALIVADSRENYGEVRLQATGFIGERQHVLVYTMRGETIWVISLRKANRREIRNYDRFIENES